MILRACDVLLTLVPALQVEIMTRWLTFKEVVRLDSALCSSHHRELYQKIIEEDYCVFGNLAKQSYFQFVWIISRRINASSMDIPPRIASEKLAQFFEQRGQHLRRVDISNSTEYTPTCDTTNSILRLLTSCVNLRVLELPGVDLNWFNICAVLPVLPHLTELNMTHCRKVSGATLVAISKNARNLQTLTLSGSEICDGLDLNDVFTLLRQCPALRTLSAAISRELRATATEAEVNTLISLIQKLHDLHLHNNKGYINDKHLQRLVEGCPNLSALYLRYISRPHDTARTILDATARVRLSNTSGHKLKKLQVYAVSSAVLQSILNISPQLTTLMFMDSCDDADVQNLMTVIGNSTLKKVEFGSCNQFKKFALLPLRNLTCFTLTHARDLAHEDVVAFLVRNPLLRKLSLTECPLLTQNTLMYIVEKCMHLEELVFNNLDPHDLIIQSADTSLATRLVNLDQLTDKLEF
eukprot:gene14609-16764_t